MVEYREQRCLGWTLVTAAFVTVGCVGAEAYDEAPYDWLIEGGRVVDGTGASPVRADVLLRDGRIVFVGVVDPDTLEVDERFDASGRVVTPGFIDPHAHGETLEDPAFENARAQGVTTLLMGMDGSSPPPAEFASHLGAVQNAGPAVNLAFLVGHNTVRQSSSVDHGDADPAGHTEMAGLVAVALDDGAFGLSTGLEYTPGIQADIEELVAIGRPVAERDGVIMSHMRDEDSGAVLESVNELLEQGRRSGARVHASHMKIVLGDDVEEARAVLEAMADARAEGRGVTGDVYPYTASYTGISILFPDWARPPNDYQEVLEDRREELAGHLRERVESRNGPAATLFGSGELAGRTLEEVAAEQGRSFEEVLIELGPGGASAAYFVMDERLMAVFLRDPHVAISSDGSPTMRHPRGYGSFARIIRRYVVEEELLSLEEAVRKMSGLTASIIGLDDPDRVEIPRGRLEVGWAADLAVFDPAEVQDRADFEQPHRLAAGMAGVWVEGQLTWKDGSAVDGPGNGRVLRDRGPRPGSQ